MRVHKRPTFVSTSTDELATVIDGSYFADRKYDRNLAFGQAKYIGALWMAHLARQYPDRRFITVSPGNTTGTEAADGLAYRYVWRPNTSCPIWVSPTSLT